MTGKEQGVESTVVQWCMSVGCVRSKVGQLRRDSTEKRLFDGVDGEGVCVLMDDTRASMTPEARVVTFRLYSDGLAVHCAGAMSRQARMATQDRRDSNKSRYRPSDTAT